MAKKKQTTKKPCGCDRIHKGCDKIHRAYNKNVKCPTGATKKMSERNSS